MARQLTQFLRPLGALMALAALAACAHAPHGATAPAIATSDAATDRAVNIAAIGELDARMAQFVSDGDTPGIATLLVRDGEVISKVEAGIADVETGAPIAEDTIYRIYSMTKPITGVAMMMLYEEGRFSLDDPVVKYIPEFENLQVLGPVNEAGEWTRQPLGRPPTMRELMSHTAGFAYGLYGDDPANRAFRDRAIMYSPDLDSFIDSVAEVPLLFQPGEKWFYSASVDIQGAIIERLTGQSFGDFLNTRIFDLLGMKDTGFYAPAEKAARLSDLFAVDPQSGAIVPYNVPQTAFLKETVAMESGGGGLVATMGDYARFARMLANGGELDGVRLIQPETLKLMRTNALPEGVSLNLAGTLDAEQAASARFGLNVGVYTNTAANNLPFGEGTYYWGGAAGTWFWVDPENNLFFIGMIQLFDQQDPDPVDFWMISAEKVYATLEQ